MFYRWRRMEEEDRGRVWRLYGWFTALHGVRQLRRRRGVGGEDDEPREWLQSKCQSEP